MCTKKAEDAGKQHRFAYGTAIWQETQENSKDLRMTQQNDSRNDCPGGTE